MREHTIYIAVSGAYEEIEAVGAAAIIVPSGDIVTLSGPTAPNSGSRLSGTRLAVVTLALERIPEGDTATVYCHCSYVIAALDRRIDRPQANVTILRRLHELLRTRPTLGRNPPPDDNLASICLHHAHALAEMARLHQNGDPIPPLDDPSRQMDLFS